MPEKIYKIDILIEKYLIRTVSTPVAKILAKTRITPNQITFMGFLITLLSCYFFLNGSYAYIAAGAVIMWIGAVFDYIDGTLARLKGRESHFGAWIDGIMDKTGESCVLLSIALGIYFTTGNIQAVFLGIAAMFMILFHGIVNYSMAATYGSNMTDGRESVDTKFSIIGFFSYGKPVFMVVVALGMLLNLGFWVIAGFAVIGNLYNLAMLAACIRKFRKDEKEKKIRPRDSKEFHKKIGVE